MKNKLTLSAALFASLWLAGCGATKIGRITADPFRYQNRTVRVDGTVVNSVGFLGTGGYQIEDGTGKIYVLSTSGVPSRGSRVSVKGTVVSAAQMLGRPIGTAIRANSQRVK